MGYYGIFDFSIIFNFLRSTMNHVKSWRELIVGVNCRGGSTGFFLTELFHDMFSEPCQASKIEDFAKIWQSSKNVSEIDSKNL